MIMVFPSFFLTKTTLRDEYRPRPENPNQRPTGMKLGRPWPEVELSTSQLGPNLRRTQASWLQLGPNLSLTGVQHGATWARLGASWA
jgi:hypothetical protein